MITDKLIEKIIEMQNPTCVGLDTLFDYLPDDMKAGAKCSSSIKILWITFATSYLR